MKKESPVLFLFCFLSLIENIGLLYFFFGLIWFLVDKFEFTWWLIPTGIVVSIILLFLASLPWFLIDTYYVEKGPE
jgi:hypothetical protein